MSWSWFPSIVSKAVGRNLGNPSRSPVGLLVSRFLVERNARLEINAVHLLGLQENHHVLEVGFGPGVGLQEACKFVKSGSIRGIDISEKMIEDATKRLSAELMSLDLHLSRQSVEKTSFEDATFDRIFHTNCYYFWPSKEAGAKELYRILKPDGFMLTALNLVGIKDGVSKGFLTEGQVDPGTYMEALKSVGFMDVEMKTERGKGSGAEFQAIYAYKK